MYRPVQKGNKIVYISIETIDWLKSGIAHYPMENNADHHVWIVHSLSDHAMSSWCHKEWIVQVWLYQTPRTYVIAFIRYNYCSLSHPYHTLGVLCLFSLLFHFVTIEKHSLYISTVVILSLYLCSWYLY